MYQNKLGRAGNPVLLVVLVVLISLLFYFIKFNPPTLQAIVGVPDDSFRWNNIEFLVDGQPALGVSRGGGDIIENSISSNGVIRLTTSMRNIMGQNIEGWLAVEASNVDLRQVDSVHIQGRYTISHNDPDGGGFVAIEVVGENRQSHGLVSFEEADGRTQDFDITMRLQGNNLIVSGNERGQERNRDIALTRDVSDLNGKLTFDLITFTSSTGDGSYVSNLEVSDISFLKNGQPFQFGFVRTECPGSEILQGKTQSYDDFDGVINPQKWVPGAAEFSPGALNGEYYYVETEDRIDSASKCRRRVRDRPQWCEGESPSDFTFGTLKDWFNDSYVIKIRKRSEVTLEGNFQANANLKFGGVGIYQNPARQFVDDADYIIMTNKDTKKFKFSNTNGARCSDDIASLTPETGIQLHGWTNGGTGGVALPDGGSGSNWHNELFEITYAPVSAIFGNQSPDRPINLSSNLYTLSGLITDDSTNLPLIDVSYGDKITGNNGRYELEFPVGSYNIMFKKDNYKSVELKNVIITDDTVINVQMERTVVENQTLAVDVSAHPSVPTPVPEEGIAGQIKNLGLSNLAVLAVIFIFILILLFYKRNKRR